MKKVVIDCFGFPATSEFFQKKKKQAFEIKSVGAKTFIRFDNADKCAMWCLDETSGAIISWTYGLWANRESLTFDLDLNQTLTIEIEGD